jgi:hypothetical protein
MGGKLSTIVSELPFETAQLHPVRYQMHARVADQSRQYNARVHARWRHDMLHGHGTLCVSLLILTCLPRSAGRRQLLRGHRTGGQWAFSGHLVPYKGMEAQALVHASGAGISVSHGLIKADDRPPKDNPKGPKP